MEGDLGGFEGTEPAKLVMFLELPVGKEEFLRIADPVKQALATTAKVASPDKVCRVLLRAFGLGCTQEPFGLGCTQEEPLFRVHSCRGTAEAVQRQCECSANAEAVRMQSWRANKGNEPCVPVWWCGDCGDTGGVLPVSMRSMRSMLAVCCLPPCSCARVHMK